MNRQEIQERFEKDNLTAVRAKLPASPHYPDPDYYFTATCILLEKLAAVDELHEAAVIAYREDIEALKAKLAKVEPLPDEWETDALYNTEVVAKTQNECANELREALK
jgi:hypothetical protein